MKSSSVRGTPIRSISADNGQGFNSRPKPGGLSGTVNRQFEGDQKINRQEGISTGTPYQSGSVNDDLPPKTTRSKYGMVDTPAAGDQAQHTSNGNGVLFNGVEQSNDYLPNLKDVMDSPVPEGAQMPQDDASLKLNEIRNGKGSYWGSDDAIQDSIVKAGGVISRGMLGTSTPAGGEMEMQEDDVLRNLGAGGAVG